MSRQAPVGDAASAHPPTVADGVAALLAERGVVAVFELTGGMITRLLDAVHRLARTPIVSMRHEQAAGFAASGFGRMTGRAAVAMATSGPGATNLLTAVGDCYFDSTPAVFITGQVNRNEQRGDRRVRQFGFQETDIVSMAAPITKWSHGVTDPGQVLAVLHRAFEVAESGRPGPVLIDIPMDVQATHLPRGDCSAVGDAGIKPTVADQRGAAVSQFAREVGAAVRDSQRPLMIAGGGIRAAGMSAQFAALVAASGIPVVHSLMGVDALAAGDRHRVGMLGTYGNRRANLTVGQSDLLIVLGSRLDVRQTGARVQQFKGDRPMFHVDIDTAELGGRVRGGRTLAADLREVLPAMTATIPARDYPDWLAWIEHVRAEFPDTDELAGCVGINPNRFMGDLGRSAPDACAFVCDVGQHQMWAAQSLQPAAGQRFITSGGMGAMGFALPAAMGVSLAAAAPVVVIAGDGGFQCNIQELQTVAQHQPRLRIVVMNNSTLGMVRQSQEEQMGGRFQSTVWGYSAPSFTAVARAYGIPARRVDSEAETAFALAWLNSHRAGPALLEVAVDTFTNVLPKVAYGSLLTVMDDPDSRLGRASGTP